MPIEVNLELNCPYTTTLIQNVLQENENDLFLFSKKPRADINDVLYWLEYEDLDFDALYQMNKSTQSTRILANAFCIRKGLIRKANFAAFVQKYLSKVKQRNEFEIDRNVVFVNFFVFISQRTDSILRDHYPETHILDLTHPDYLDEALNEAFELRDALEVNIQEETESAVPFILKASILDKASELFIFTRQDQLEEFFQKKYDEEEETVTNVREWIVQRYIDNPKLLPSVSNRKFHLRVYIVAHGDLRVYVYDGILALFASLPYEKHFTPEDNLRHITNTCAQVNTTLNEDDLVKEFSTLNDFDEKTRENIFEQIRNIVKEIFTGLHPESSIFQPLNNAFEIFGLDFLIDQSNRVYFLEANAYPDFKQTGNSLSVLIKELFENVLQKIIFPYFSRQPSTISSCQRQLHLVYDQQRRR